MVELLTVVLIIVILAALTSAIAGWAQKRVQLTRTQGEIASFESAIESYKLDVGMYPTSSLRRVASYTDGYAWFKYTNSWLLYQQLATDGRSYYKFKPRQIQNPAKLPAPWGTWSNAADMTIIMDAWGKPYNFFNPTSFTNQNLAWEQSSCIKYNSQTYDLWSQGPDRTDATSDDIKNWQR